MFRIRRFSVLSTANTVAIMYFIGLLIVLVPLVLIFSISQVTVTDTSGQQLTFGAGGLVFVLLIPILYGIVAWVGTVDVRSNAPAVVAAPSPAAPPPPQG